jgi:hypothetical protein
MNKKSLIVSWIVHFKTTFVLLIIFSFSFVNVFWSEWTDCVEIARLDKSQFADAVTTALQQWNPSYSLQIFTKKDIGTALFHNQQHCCQENTNSTDCTWKLDWQNYFAESPFLVDHLVNVWMRKLNGIEEHCSKIQIDCTMPGTEINQNLNIQWRKEVTKFAEDIDWGPSIQLYELFKKYRGEEKDFVDKTKKWLLANAYFTMCDEVVKIKQSVSLVTNVKNVTNQESAWRKWCENLILQRYRQEAAYVQSLMVSRWIAYVSNNMQAYLKTHFIDNRMNLFVDKLWKMDACFNMVLKYVTRTSCCVN